MKQVITLIGMLGVGLTSPSNNFDSATDLTAKELLTRFLISLIVIIFISIILKKIALHPKY